MTTMTTMLLTTMAIRAARNRHVWGEWATMRYLAKRGVPIKLYQIAVALEATATEESYPKFPDVDVLVLSGKMRQWSGRGDGK